MKLPSFMPLAKRALALLSLLLFAAMPRATAADPSLPSPSPTPDPAIKTLSDKLIAAPDDAARDALLAAAPPALAHSAQLRRTFHHDYGLLIYSGDYDRAQTLALYARRLCEQNGDRSGVAKEEQNLGNIEGSRGDNRAALARFESCQRTYKELGETEHLAGVTVCAAIIHLQLGDYRRALEALHEAEPVYRDGKNKENLITVLNTFGTVYDAQGLPDRAMDYFQQALALAGNDESWQVYLFHNIANVYEARGDLARAAELIARSTALAEKQNDKPRLAEDLQKLASFHRQGLDGGDPARAETELRRSLAISEAVGDKRRQTSDLTDLGDLLRVRGGTDDLTAASALAARAAAIARDTGEPANVWRSRTLEGKLARAMGHPVEARAAFEDAIAAIEDARGHLAAGDESAAAFLADKLDAYEQMVALLVEQQHPAEALAMAERAKARALLEVMRGPKFDPAVQMTPAERATADRLAVAVANANRDLAAARAAQPPPLPEKLTALLAALARARHERDSAEQDFFTAHPELRLRQPPEDKTNPRLPLDALTDAGRAVLLEYVVTDDRTFLFAIQNDGPSAPPDPVYTPPGGRAAAGGGGMPALVETRVFTLPIGRAALTRRTQDFRRALADRGMGWQTAARELGQSLLGPARGAFADAQRLVIVPDGPLWELPFQALALDDKTLWEKWPVSFAPSLTFLAEAQRSPAARPLSSAPTLLACGDPSLGNVNNHANVNAPAAPSPGPALMGEETVPLPDAARQVRELGELYGQDHSRTLVGAAAHEDEFKKLAGGYDVIHFATHGLLNDSAPMYSRLLMSQTDLAPDEDGLLEAWEWLPLNLHARLVVLSACETGRGRIGAGEGVLGQSWALFAAGCPAAVVSQWKVDSASTTELMIGFHRRLLAGEEPAAALREAGLELSKRPGCEHPFYWAPFVLVGANERIAAPGAAVARAAKN